MVIAINHKFTSAKADSADASLIRPSNWNDTHNITMATSRVMGRGSAGVGVVEELTLGNGLAFSGTSLIANPAQIVTSTTIKAGLGGSWTFDNNITVAGQAFIRDAIELGNTTGVASVSYIDFHTSATAVDYNVRMIASGDTANGQGTLDIIGGIINLLAPVRLQDDMRIRNAASQTKQIAFNAAGITAGQTRTITMPDRDINLGNVTSSYTSPQQVYSNNSLLTMAHGLGVVPSFVALQLVCVVANAGYAVGDIVTYPAVGIGFNTSAYGSTCYIDTTNVNLRIPPQGFAILDKSTGSPTGLTAASWRIVIKAYP